MMRQSFAIPVYGYMITRTLVDKETRVGYISKRGWSQQLVAGIPTP